MGQAKTDAPRPGSARVACVGVGAWGRNLARNFHALGALAMVCDADLARAAEVAAACGGVPVARELSEVLDRPDIDAVCVATPAATHADLALRALRAGKDVFVEKPLALSLTSGQELVDEARLRGAVLMVGHLLRYHPAVRALEVLVSQGALGATGHISARRCSLGRIRDVEDVLWSLAPHDISLILALAGGPPRRVSCTLSRVLGTPRADIANINLHFQGFDANVQVSWLSPSKEQRLVVSGARGVAVFDDLAEPDELVVHEDPVAWVAGLPAARKPTPRVVPTAVVEPLRAECQAFLHAVRTRVPPLTDGAESLAVLAVLEAATRSAAAGGQSVDVVSALSRASVHATAIVDDDVQVGEGTAIWHFSHVLRGSRIGAGCRVGQNVVIGPNASVGDGVKIQNNVSVYEGVTLEDHVFCGPSMVFTNVHNPRSEIPRMRELRRTLVRRGASLGANCTVLCGITIGTYAFVGAGAVVLRDVPDFALVVGNPARQKGWVCACGERLGFDAGQATCAACGACYTLSGHHVERS